MWWYVLVSGVAATFVMGWAVYVVGVLSTNEGGVYPWYARCMAVVALSLAACTVLLVPFEVACGKGGVETDTRIVEQILLFCNTFMVCVVLPCTLIYNECGVFRGASVQRWVIAIAVTAVLYVAAIVMFYFFWWTLFITHTNYAEYRLPAPSVVNIESPSQDARMEFARRVISLRAPLHISLTSLISAAGWVALAVFGGVGLVSLPLNGFRQFVHRPRAITEGEYEAERQLIAEETARLLESGRRWESQYRCAGWSRKRWKIMVAFRREVRDVEEQFNRLETAHHLTGADVLYHYSVLVVAIVLSIASLAWVLQVVVWDIVHVHRMFDAVLVVLDSTWTLMGASAYGCFSLYLLWCTIDGCLMLGENMNLFPVFPLKVGGTTARAFLLNAVPLLLASMASLWLCTVSFERYAATSHVAWALDFYTPSFPGTRVIARFAPIAMLGVSLVSALWLLLCPRRQAGEQ